MLGPLSYIGGKRALAKQIIAIFPEHTTYVEAFSIYEHFSSPLKDTSADGRDLIPHCCCATYLHLPVNSNCGGPNRRSQWLAGSVDGLDDRFMRSPYSAQRDRAFDRLHQCGRSTPIRYVGACRIPCLQALENSNQNFRPHFPAETK
jgi:hypothetical protein